MSKRLRNFRQKDLTAGILADLQASSLYQRSEKIAAFWPFDFEFDLKPLFKDSQKLWLLPKVQSDKKLIFVAFKGQEDLIENRWGLMEPSGKFDQIPDLIIVPGLAWNEENFRIGFGGGYYDRYLVNFRGQTVSLAYDFQKLTFTPDPWDVKIDEVISR